MALEILTGGMFMPFMPYNEMYVPVNFYNHYLTLDAGGEGCAE